MDIKTGEQINETIVQGSGKGKFAQEIVIGKHVLEGDEPIVNGK